MIAAGVCKSVGY